MVKAAESPAMPVIARALRFAGASFILVNGGVHIYLWAHSYRDVRVIGPLFVVNALAALLIAAALLWRPEGITALLGLALSAGTFGAFMLTVTVGLFGFGTGWDLEAVVAAVAEVGAILLLGLWWVITTRKRGAPALGERVVAD